MSGQEFGAGQGLDDDVQTGQDGVGLGQEVTVVHQLGLGNVSELTELALVLRVNLDEAFFTIYRKKTSIYYHDIIVRYNDAYPKKRRVFRM